MILLLLLLCPWSSFGLFLHGSEIVFSPVEEGGGGGGRSLGEDQLLIVKRNFTCMLSDETSLDSKGWIQRRGKARLHGHKELEHHQSPVPIDYKRGKEFHRKYMDILSKDQQASVMTISKDTFVVFDSKYDKRKCDSVSPFLPAHKYSVDSAVNFPVNVKVIPDYVLPGGTKAGVDMWNLKAPSLIWPSIELIAQSQKVLWIDSPRPVKLFSKRARMVHLDRPSLHLTAGGILPEGDGITVMVSDTGIDLSHGCFYRDGILPPSETQSVQCGPHPKICAVNTAYPGLTDYRGENGAHGTMSASAAVCYNTSLVVGMATGAKVLFYDFTPAGTDSDIYLPLVDKPGLRTYWEWITEGFSIAKASIVSQSWGAYTNGKYDSVCVDQDERLYNDPTLVAVSAAGNDGEDGAHLPSSPCASKNGLCVGAVFGSNHKAVAGFSSYGLINGQRNPVRVYSPGVREVLAFGYYDPVAGHTQPVEADGTSFSAPNIAGLIARYQQHYKARHQQQLPLGPLVHALLIGSSVKVETRVSHRTGQLLGKMSSNSYGVPVITKVGMEESGIFLAGQDAEVAYCYRAKERVTENVTLTLAFYDYKGVAFSSVNLVNNLNMKVYKNHRLIFDGKDSTQVDERFTTGESFAIGESMRVVVYETDYSVIGKIPFGFYLNSLQFERSLTCGVCQSTDMETCGAGQISEGNSFCNVTSGMMTECLPTKNGILADLHTTTCEGTRFVGFVVNGQCVPYDCLDGYYYDHAINQCRCIPGFRKTTQLICNHNELFVVATADDLLESQPPIQKVIGSSAVNRKTDRIIVLLFILAVLM